MTTEAKAQKKRNGHNAHIALMVGCTRFYVCRVLSNPDKYNSDLAQKIKEADKDLQLFIESKNL